MLLIYNARLVDRDIDKKAAILVNGKKIEGILTPQAAKKMLEDKKIPSYDAGGCLLLPSFVDMHAHFRDPGQTQKEDIESGCHAAAAGGFGTLVLMPNTNPVVSSLEAAEKNNKKAFDLGLCQVFQSVSITQAFDGKTLSHLDTLNPKKVPLITEDGREVLDSSVMLEGMKKAALKKIIVSCHSEDPFLHDKATELRQKALKSTDKKEKIRLLKEAERLLEVAEDVLTFRNIRLAKEAGCHLHLCHVSTAACLQAVRLAKKEGVNVTCEITPHHLGLNTKNDSNQLFIVNPPLRSPENQRAVIEALRDGSASCIATDHAPHTLEDKKNGCPGFSGLETAFSLCYKTLVLENDFSLNQLSALMSANPAELLGLHDRGLLAEGYFADFALVDLSAEWTVKGQNFASRGKYSPLEGKKLPAKIKAAFFRGKLVYENKE